MYTLVGCFRLSRFSLPLSVPLCCFLSSVCVCLFAYLPVRLSVHLFCCRLLCTSACLSSCLSVSLSNWHSVSLVSSDETLGGIFGMRVVCPCHPRAYEPHPQSPTPPQKKACLKVVIRHGRPFNGERNVYADHSNAPPPRQPRLPFFPGGTQARGTTYSGMMHSTDWTPTLGRVVPGLPLVWNGIGSPQDK